MKRTVAACCVATLLASPVYAEDSVAIIGDYYLERSTRVISPAVKINKDLPYDSTLQFGYLVDQITSASGAFTATDEPFSEYRQELSLDGTIALAHGISPTIGGRYSHEGDYKSHEVHAGVDIDLPNDRTTLSAGLVHQYDIVKQRGRRGFEDDLHATYFSLGASHVLGPKAIAGLAFEAQILRGYQENPYRVEQHPRARDRFCLAPWVRYRVTSTKTTIHADYRFYNDDWDLTGHTFGLKVTQELLPSLEVQPEIRFHTQDDVFFVELFDNFITADPKLRALDTTRLGARFVWTLSFLAGGALDMFSNAQIQPSYYYFFQDNRYGDAHIVQLGGFWPFGAN